MENVDDAERLEEDSDEDEGFDYDALAAAAITSAGLVPRPVAVKRAPKELSLHVNIDEDQLYMRPTADMRGGRKRRPVSSPFNTAAVPGRSSLHHSDFAEGCEAAIVEGNALAKHREVRGAPVRPVDDSKLRRKEARKLKEDRLERWYGMKKMQVDPELEKELKAIKLRANLDPKRFYKGNDTKELPKYFAVATEIAGGMRPAGLKATPEPRPGSGRSLLQSALYDEKITEWTTKRRNEVLERGMASTKSGHGNRNGKSTKRGGAWKKAKKG
eukprot:TRINITY_DN2732_c0_g1_i2.p1 TRINITY_DN2732_c0_g1~~TRINITY_DN2732_c0_g1_i2.p1  ORF type:complete len:289 (+),score=71.40 TRINITY_DN2732_c0_g1_i2:53-868(+)